MSGYLARTSNLDTSFIDCIDEWSLFPDSPHMPYDTDQKRSSERFVGINIKTSINGAHITKSRSLSSSIKERDDRQTIFFVLIDHRRWWSPDNLCHGSEDSTDYTSGRHLVVVRLRLRINTDATAVANHSSGLLRSVVVDVPRLAMVISSKNILYACSDGSLHFPSTYSCSLVYFPR